MKAEFTKKGKCVSDVFAPDVPTGASGPTEAFSNLPQILSVGREFSLKTFMSFKLISLV